MANGTSQLWFPGNQPPYKPYNAPPSNRMPMTPPGGGTVIGAPASYYNQPTQPPVPGWTWGPQGWGPGTQNQSFGGIGGYTGAPPSGTPSGNVPGWVDDPTQGGLVWKGPGPAPPTGTGPGGDIGWGPPGTTPSGNVGWHGLPTTPGYQWGPLTDAPVATPAAPGSQFPYATPSTTPSGGSTTQPNVVQTLLGTLGGTGGGSPFQNLFGNPFAAYNPYGETDTNPAILSPYGGP
jgi:hypothetical protein